MDKQIELPLSNPQTYVGRNPAKVIPPHPLDDTFNQYGWELDGDKAKSVKADYDAIDLRVRKGRAFSLGMSVEQYDIAQKAYAEHLLSRNPPKK